MRFSLQIREKFIAFCVYLLIFLTLLIYLTVGIASAHGMLPQPVSEYHPVKRVY